MSWRKALAIEVILDEVNTAFPGRDTRTDGTISGYAGSKSAHQINSRGVVCAVDITVGRYPDGITPEQARPVVDKILKRLHEIGYYAYAIYKREIAHADVDWEWVPYHGSSPHTDHFHIAVDWDIYSGGAPSGRCDYDDQGSWGIADVVKLTGNPAPKPPAPVPAGPAGGDIIYLPPVDGRGRMVNYWAIYELDDAPVAGNQLTGINPWQYGGLTYPVLRWVSKTVAVIPSVMYGQVQIYVGSDTPAEVRRGKAASKPAGKPAPAPKERKQTVTLPAGEQHWNVYKLNVQPVDGNEFNGINTARYGELTYEVEGWTVPGKVAIIRTKQLGRVQIYVAPGTGAVIK